MFPRVLGLLFESKVSIRIFMRAFEEGHEGSLLAEGSREATSQPALSSSASASDAEAAAAHGVFGCPSRNCAVDGADCMMVQVRRKMRHG
jgi:hypothetical protein